MEENEVQAKDMIAQEGVQSARSRYLTSFRPVSHSYPLRITVQCCKSLPSSHVAFRARYFSHENLT